jgi:hypothetical protein
MKACGVVEVEIHSFLTFAIHGLSGQLHAPVALPLGNKPLESLNRKIYESQSRTGK